MSLDSSKVLIGTPDQATTGAVAFADTSATMPTTALSELNSATWTDCGYVSEDGVSVTPTYNTKNIKDWSKSTVRTLLEEFTGEVKFAFIQTDYESLAALFGEDNVSKAAASGSHGEQLTINIGARMAPSKAWCFSMKDGEAKVRIVLPNAQPVLDGSVQFVANDAIKWAISLKCNSDEDGNSIIILTDDGETTTTTTAGA